MSSINKNSLIYGIAVAVLVILFSSYFYIGGKGVKTFEDFLYDNDLSDAIQYHDVDYSPLSDTITLDNIDLEINLFEIGKNKLKMTSIRVP